MGGVLVSVREKQLHITGTIGEAAFKTIPCSFDETHGASSYFSDQKFEFWRNDDNNEDESCKISFECDAVKNMM